MEAAPQFRVVDAERLSGDVEIEFDSGECALYSAALLHSMLTRANKLELPESEEIDVPNRG
jgi:hypothetical protein